MGIRSGSGNVVFSASNGLTATGSTQGTALRLTGQLNVVATVATGTGVMLPNLIGVPVYVYNRGANTLNVYPPGSSIIDGNAASAPVTIAAGATANYVGVSATQWFTS